MQSLLIRKHALVSDLDEALVRARAGAAYLDYKLGPGWEWEIDPEVLDIASPFNCVLGQLGRAGYFVICFPGPGRVVEYGFSCGILEDILSLFYRPPALRRAFELLTEAWRVVLDERRHADEWPGADVRRHAGSGKVVGSEAVTAA